MRPTKNPYGPLKALTAAEAADMIERTVKTVMTDLYEPRVNEEVKRIVHLNIRKHVRSVMNEELLFPVRRTWRWRTWELSLGRRR
jgi:hypothetical protein